MEKTYNWDRRNHAESRFAFDEISVFTIGLIIPNFALVYFRLSRYDEDFENFLDDPIA